MARKCAQAHDFAVRNYVQSHYVIVAVSRATGLIVGEQVSQDCGLATLQAVVDTLPSAARYTSDGHAAYAELVWPEGAEHVVSVGKEETYTIESLNANLRTYLKRLVRRSRCFSRSLEALRRAVRLFVSYYNHRQRLYLAHPSLRGRLPLLNWPLPNMSLLCCLRSAPFLGVFCYPYYVLAVPKRL